MRRRNTNTHRNWYFYTNTYFFLYTLQSLLTTFIETAKKKKKNYLVLLPVTVLIRLISFTFLSMFRIRFTRCADAPYLSGYGQESDGLMDIHINFNIIIECRIPVSRIVRQ